LLKEWTSVDITGKLLEWLRLVQVLSLIYCLHCNAQTPMLVRAKNCVPVWCITVIFMMKVVLNKHSKLKFCQQKAALKFVL
jgi:hypothetical protein